MSPTTQLIRITWPLDNMIEGIFGITTADERIFWVRKVFSQHGGRLCGSPKSRIFNSLWR